MGANLVTLAEYKAYAGIVSPAQDATINSIIPKASQLVKSLCRRSFVDYVNDFNVEVFSGNGEDTLILKEYPLISVSSVETSADYGNTYTDLDEYAGYVVDNTKGYGAIVAPGGSFPKAINGYKVTYTAGYETLPEDLKVAVLDLVTYYLKNDQSVHSPKAPGTNSVQIEYITTSNLPAHIKRVLDLYVSCFD